MAKASNRIKLTDAAVARIKPPETGRDQYSDMLLPGFRLRVTDKGLKSFSLLTRYRGNQIRVNCGKFPVTSLAEARQTARDALAAIEQGKDPGAARREARERISDLFNDVAALFVERYAKNKNKGWKETERIFQKYVNPRWATRSLKTITRADVVALLDDIEDAHGIYMANRVLAQVRKLFNWALVERALIEVTPIVPGMARKGEKKRDRFLDEGEISSFLGVSETLGYPFGPLFKLLLVTGQRRDECASMKWEHVDIGARQWLIPGELTKSGRSQLVPLSLLALEIIDTVPKVAEKGYVFTTHSNGERPVSGFSKAKARCDKALDKYKIEPWRIHDLRRSAATHMRRIGISREITSAVLGHAPVGVTAEHYDQYDMLAEKTDALERWSRELERLMGRDLNNVIELVSR